VDLCLLSLCERLPPPGPTLLPYTTLFRSRVDQAQDEEAERLAREGLEMSMRQLRPNDPAIASATLALGQILEDRGRYAEAIKVRSEEHTSELQSPYDLVCRLLLEKKNHKQ